MQSRTSKSENRPVYDLVPKDPSRPSWAVSVVANPSPKRPRINPDLSPVMHQFFDTLTTSEKVLKSEYASTACEICGRYADDDVFDLGFLDPVQIRLKGDFGLTDDRVFAISEKFKDVLCKAEVRGFETKPLGSSGWHAMRVTERVDCDETVMQMMGLFCSGCGRARRTPGAFTKFDRLRLPSLANTFFTTKKTWSKPFRDRDTFLTEDVVNLLKAEGIGGGWCNRLLTQKEAERVEDLRLRGRTWRPSKSIVDL